MPREISYRITAIFEIGVYDFDKAYVVMPMEDAQLLLLSGDQIGMIEVKVTDPDDVDAILTPLKEKVAAQAVQLAPRHDHTPALGSFWEFPGRVDALTLTCARSRASSQATAP